MALFKAKRKDVESYETEMSLPPFYIDSNGFIMFEDQSLGGACVMEVVPHVSTEGITHEDPVFHNESTDDDAYEPSVNALFGDARGWVYAPWVSFLNSLQAQDEADEPTHVQLLMKKCHSDEWYTRIDYASYMAHKELDPVAKTYKTAKSVRGALKGRRALDYLNLLDGIKKKTDELPQTQRDIRHIAGYKMKFFLVVSYTPSSEGWWLDGRDSDYYISDHASPFLTFASSQDNLVERITDMMASRIAKKNGSREIVGGAADDFFWIESDRTAQIIATRMHKIMTAIKKWEKTHPMPMPFHLEKMDGREAAALIRFFPNILTPYWDKIWTLNSDQNDMLYNFDVRKALELNDAAALGDQTALFEDIKADAVDMRHGKDEQDAFLAQFRDKDFKELRTSRSEYDDMFWTPELEEERKAYQEEMERRRAESEDDIWQDFAGMFALDEELKTRDQQREEFLRKYKRQSGKSLSGE